MALLRERDGRRLHVKSKLMGESLVSKSFIDGLEVAPQQRLFPDVRDHHFLKGREHEKLQEGVPHEGDDHGDDHGKSDDSGRSGLTHAATPFQKWWTGRWSTQRKRTGCSDQISSFPTIDWAPAGSEASG